MSLMAAMLICLAASDAPAAPAPDPGAPPLVCFDLKGWLEAQPGDSVLKYDAVKLVASFQGLVNRDAPRLVIRFLDGEGASGPINVDDYWNNLLLQGWWKGRVVEEEKDLAALLRRFPEQAAGLVLWDPAVPATANVAATVCGVDGWLPVRAGSPLLPLLGQAGAALPVKLDLTGKFTGAVSGSAKCDAYLWAMDNYMKMGGCLLGNLAEGCAGTDKPKNEGCNTTLLAYFIDGYTQEPGKPGFSYPDLRNATLANHDYYIARRAFFFDLSPWGDETPVDDPNQPPGTDRKTFESILKIQYARNKGAAFTTVGGFTPWNLKYTNHGPAGGKHEPVPTEWEHAALLSSHNALMDADALGLGCMANASAWGHHPLKERYEQNPRPQKRGLQDKTYVLVYMGDYDSAAWLSYTIPRVWDDPARGSIPIAWAFNPNLADRAPHVFDHIYATKTPNDWFIGGDSGAGYINPNLLIGDRLGSGLPDALNLWVSHNRSYYTRFDYSITGFVINGFHGKMPERIQRAYATFSPDGVGMQLGFDKPLAGDTPFLRHAGDIYPGDNLIKAADQMSAFARPKKPQFLIFRWILQSPGTLKTVRDLMVQRHGDANWEFCDPHTFFDLYRQSLKK